MVMMRGMGGGRIAIFIAIDRACIGICSSGLIMPGVMILQVSSERTRKSIGRMGVTIGVQGAIHHRNRGLDDQQGDQHDGQSRHTFPKPVVQMVEQEVLDGVISAAIVCASGPEINASL